MNIKYGLSLTGGGARGSYQAGAIQGLFEVLNESGISTKNSNIFKYLSGVSAGAINATAIAGGFEHPTLASDQLVHLWSQIEPENVYRTDFKSITSNSVKWVRDLTLGHLAKKKLAQSLLDTSPLWEHLEDKISFENIKKNIQQHKINALACTAYSYTKNRTVTFLQTEEDISWNRQKRISQKSILQLDHVVASCAIPLLFPAIQIDGEYYADGGFRNLSPISPLVHMNTNKILMIGVRGSDEFSDQKYVSSPTIAKISGAMLNALFLIRLILISKD